MGSGKKDFAIISTGKKIKTPKHLKNYSERLKVPLIELVKKQNCYKKENRLYKNLLYFMRK